MRADKIFSVAVDVLIVAIPLLVTPGWRWSWVNLPGPYSANMLCFWATLIVGRWGATQVRRGKHIAEWNVYWSRHAYVLAGNISEARQLLFGRAKGGREVSAQVIVAGLLQQIVEVARDLTRAPEGTIFESCMLLPVTDEGGNTALQAEVYNRQTSDHRHQPIPLDALGAAPKAYRENRVVVVPNTEDEPFTSEFKGRRYKCIAAFPVDLGDGSGKDRAVVTIDASVPYILTDVVVDRLGIKDAISPFLSVIGLVEMEEQRLRGERADGADGSKAVEPSSGRAPKAPSGRT